MIAQLVRITSDIEIPYLTYNDQPVLTFILIDKAHGRPDGTAKRNFSTNRKRFIDGEDYFYLTDSKGLDEIRTSHPCVLKDAAHEITLITESGYLMLVKSFTDDLSWQIQRQLVKLYFRVKEAVNQPAPQATIAAQPTMHLALNRALRTIGRHSDAFIRQAAYKEVVQICGILGLECPPAHLIGKQYDQLQMEV